MPIQHVYYPKLTDEDGLLLMRLLANNMQTLGQVTYSGEAYQAERARQEELYRKISPHRNQLIELAEGGE